MCNFFLNINYNLSKLLNYFFQALSDVAKSVSIDYNLPGAEKYNKPTNVVTRGLLKK